MVDAPDSEPTLVESQPFLVVDKPAGWSLEANRQSSIVDWLGDMGLSLAAPLVELDEDESGLVVFGDRAALEARVTFEALVTPGLNAAGHISKPLHRETQTVDGVTRYELVEDFGICSLARLQPDTPRLNQVREHLQTIGLTIIGDRRFRGPKFVKVPQFPGRLWLHLTRVEAGGRIFESALPDLLARHLHHLRGH